MNQLTRLQAFIEANEIKASMLSREARVGRQHILRLRTGRAEPTRPLMIPDRGVASNAPTARGDVGAIRPRRSRQMSPHPALLAMPLQVVLLRQTSNADSV